MSEQLPKAAYRDPAIPRLFGSPADATRKILSEALFNGSREVVIAHGKRQYRLRITANGKLILTA